MLGGTGRVPVCRRKERGPEDGCLSREQRVRCEAEKGTVVKYARCNVYWKIGERRGSCRGKNGSLDAVWKACVLPL